MCYFYFLLYQSGLNFLNSFYFYKTYGKKYYFFLRELQFITVYLFIHRFLKKKNESQILIQLEFIALLIYISTAVFDKLFYIEIRFCLNIKCLYNACNMNVNIYARLE